MSSTISLFRASEQKVQSLIRQRLNRSLGTDALVLATLGVSLYVGNVQEDGEFDINSLNFSTGEKALIFATMGLPVLSLVFSRREARMCARALELVDGQLFAQSFHQRSLTLPLDKMSILPVGVVSFRASSDLYQYDLVDERNHIVMRIPKAGEWNDAAEPLLMDIEDRHDENEKD